MPISRTVVVACALLSPIPAFAAAPPATQPQAGACALALQAPPAAQPDQPDQPAEPKPQPHKKININFLFDPCSMTNAERDTQQADKVAMSRDQLLQEYESWMEWNRQHGDGNARQESWWSGALQELPPTAGPGATQPTGWVPGALAALPMVTRNGSQPWLEAAEPLPAVPEPPGYALWLAGLACLAVAARRRIQRR